MTPDIPARLDRELLDDFFGDADEHLLGIRQALVKLEGTEGRTRPDRQKKARLKLAGQDTAIDKYLIELLKDPLLHLVRNASAELHQKIFGIFERGADAEQYEGTGMGLAIVARALQRMGGTCGLESEPGRGSRFWIELPAA